MTYRAEMHRLAKAVSTLLTDGGRVPGDDVRAALAGHLSLVELLDTVHRDLAPNSIANAKDTISALEQDPVAALGRLLRQHPRQLDQPISSVLSSTAASTAGQAWRDVAAAATIAQHDWQTANTLTRPRDDAAWSEMADIAALSQAIAVLDGDIADSLSTVARWEDGATYRTAAQSGLHVAAREVRDLAAAGPLPAAAELAANPARKVVVVRRADDLPAALTRLGHIAATSTEITPAHVALASRAVAQASLAAASTFETAGDVTTATALREHGGLLAAASGLGRRVASLHPGDGQTLAQANAVRQFLTGLRDRGQTLAPDVAVGVAVAVTAASTGLRQTADEQVARGKWLIMRDDGRSREWGPVRGVWEAPRLQSAIPAAAKAHVSSRALPTATITPRTQLAHSLEQATVFRAARPPTPSSGPARGR